MRGEQRKEFKRALKNSLVVLAVGLLIYYLLDIRWLAFYLLLVTSFAFGAIKHTERYIDALELDKAKGRHQNEDHN
jgi:hypothetical protein